MAECVWCGESLYAEPFAWNGLHNIHISCIRTLAKRYAPATIWYDEIDDKLRAFLGSRQHARRN